MKNYIYHGTRNLIALPGRAVTTFPSGLVRVDRTYACRTADAERYRREFAVGNLLPMDDGKPAFDGAYIFPEAQEEQSEDGFYRFKVSAYGRVNATGTVQSHFEEGFADLIATSILPPASQTNFSKIACVNEVATLSFVIPNDSNPVQSLPRQLPLKVFVREDGKLVPITNVYKPGSVVSPSGIFVSIRTTTTVTINNIIEDSPGTVFGAWKEVIYRIRASALVRITTVQGN
jgi:hypothetical protein